MATSISSSIIACLKSFNEFVDDIRYLEDKDDRGLVPSAWEDELGRLRMWAANIGAHQTGQSSLDYRLRDASHVRAQIIRLLQGLLQRLQDARDVLADAGEESHDEEAAEIDASDEEDRKTEIQELQEILANYINCLFQMSMLVRKPAQHDLYLGSERADVAAFEPFDYNHVREKFPKANDALVKRLGYAITRRRKYLKYRERHAAKLRQGISNVQLGVGDDCDVQEHRTVVPGTASNLSDTVATEFEQQNIDFDDKASNTVKSQTSYAPTLLSGGSVVIPPPPKASMGRLPFECPYCLYVIKIDSIHSWNKHVFQDLQPYICISPICRTPDKLYSTRHEWLHHSYTAHREVMTDDSISKESSGLVHCLLCKEEVERGNQYDRHVARHLQELSLFILPSAEQDSDVDEDEEADSSSNTESVSVSVARSHDDFGSREDLTTGPVEQQAAMKGMESSYETPQKEQYEEDGKEHVTESENPEERLTQLEDSVEKQRLLAPDDPNTLIAASELVVRYLDLGEYKKATALGEHVTKAMKEVLGLEHPEALRSILHLGRSYHKQGQRDFAEELYQQALDAFTRTLGSFHKFTLITLNYLGDLYKDQGRLEQAEAMYRQALNGNEKTMGPHHVSTLISMRNLGDVCLRSGKLVEVEALYQKALQGYENNLGPYHVETLWMVYDLGLIYKRLGKLAEAEVMYKRAMTGHTKRWGPSDPSTLYIAEKLHYIQEQQRNLAEAQATHERAPTGNK